MAYSVRLAALFLTALSATNPTLLVTGAPTASPPYTSPHELQQQQVDNIIDALIGAGDFASWANMLSNADPSSLPITATLFIPGDNALTHLPSPPPLNFDPFIFPYHIVPQRLTFSDLQLFPINSRLPTLLPNSSILITNNSLSNFTLDASLLTQPDLYITTAVSVHGIATILDYAVYGNGRLSSPEPPPLPPSHDVPAPPALTQPDGELMGRRISDAACLCAEFPVVFSVLCAALALKMHRNPLSR
ncbi:FAS1 domain-containing protein SELMODRAFT_448915-like [Malania oleifera]|uniref:FAS1 domain-containing protein SELMODRAFT_448915-like n=1 Tax=Malania oleifera TaxID=397392 RepID=UPI0025AE480A|nr:FAS1 domain-containing protein SELMODRAFT_448915-like [Malania oleifera]